MIAGWRSFPGASSLIGRKRNNIKNWEPLSGCDKCDFRCVRMNTLKQHVQTVHEGVKPAFKCQVCDYTCYRKAQLERHMFEHDGDPFKCDLCQFSTKYKATIINHMKTHGPKNLMCELCEYATHSG